MSSHVAVFKHPPSSSEDLFRTEVFAGLNARPRALSPRWFYDRRGSELFEAITALPEYYLTRAESNILQHHAAEIARITGLGRALIELGSGSSLKTPWLLKALEPSAYVPIDICGDFLHQSTAALAKRFPALPIHPVIADFMGPFPLPAQVRNLSRVGCFAGSTIGNMTVPVAVEFLRATARTLGENAHLLIGIDRIKDTRRLIAAYDDAQGITAQFNLNLIHRINRDLQGTMPVEAFRHVALWNDYEARIEMHLEAIRDIRFTVAGESFSIATGETIHTENSFKYGPREARTLLRAGGWTPITEWTDPEGLFALILASNSAPSRLSQ
ncbi:MAG: L-histidine N(alpha)-methyltransferase [Steroidobacteraceae bacterium]